MVDHPHALGGLAEVEGKHVEHVGHVEEEEDQDGNHQGGLGQGQRVGRPTKLSGGRAFNTDATPEDVEDVHEVGTGLRDEDNVVHQALHGHVETIGIGQNLKISQTQYN